MTTVCPICQGTGWKPVEQEGVRGVTRCECVVAERTPRQFAVARIPPRYEHCDLDNFDEINASLRQAKLLARRYAEEFLPDTDHGLLFMGPPGVGKTHLAVAVLKHLIVARGVVGLFYDFRELLKEIQASYNPVAQSSEVAVLEPVLRADVLVLDDVGAVKPSLWVLDTVGYIINARYNDRRPLLLTTSYFDKAATRTLADGTELKTEDTLADRLGERVSSRLYEMCRLVPMAGEDFRSSVRKASFRS